MQHFTYLSALPLLAHTTESNYSELYEELLQKLCGGSYLKKATRLESGIIALGAEHAHPASKEEDLVSLKQHVQYVENSLAGYYYCY